MNHNLVLEAFMPCSLAGTQAGVLILELRLSWSPHATSNFTDTHKIILGSEDLKGDVKNLSPGWDNHQAILSTYNSKMSPFLIKKHDY